MPRHSVLLAIAIVIGTLCTVQPAANASGGATKFVKTDLSCLSGTTCAARIQLPANKLIGLKGISCADVSSNVTSTDLKIIENGATKFAMPLLIYEEAQHRSLHRDLIMYQNFLINTSASELWLVLNSTVPGQMAATCYAAF